MLINATENAQDRAQYVVTHFTGLTKSNRRDVCFSSCSQVSTTQSKTYPLSDIRGIGLFLCSIFILVLCTAPGMEWRGRGCGACPCVCTLVNIHAHTCRGQKGVSGDSTLPLSALLQAGQLTGELSESSCLHFTVLQVQPYLTFSHGWLTLQTQHW